MTASLCIYPANADGDVQAAQAANIYIQDAQIEQGLVARDYIETTTTAVEGGITDNVPRLDYTDSSCPALLLEPQRTNVVENSEYHSGSTYGNQNVSIVDNDAVSPEGLQNAAKIVLNNGSNPSNGGHSYSFNSTSGTTYTISVFAKAGEYRYFTFTYGSIAAGGGHFDLQEGTLLGTITHSAYSNETASIEDYGNGWYRLVVSLRDNSTATGRFLSMKPSSSASVPNNNNYSSTGDGTSGAYIYGFQLEASASYATSYIPTYGSSVTRVGETCGDAGNASTFNSTEGVLYAEISGLANGGVDRSIALSDGSTSNYLRITLHANSNRIAFYSNKGVNYNNYDFSQTDDLKIAFTYKNNDWKIYINGTLKSTITSALTFSPNTLSKVEFNLLGLNPFYGNTKQVLVFPTALTDQEAIALTTI